MQVQGADTEAAAAEVARNESANSMRFSGAGRGWRGGEPGQRRPIFRCVPAAHPRGVCVQGRGTLQAPTPPLGKDAGLPGFRPRQVFGDKAGAWAGADPAFLSNSAGCRVTPATLAPWRQLPELQAQDTGRGDQPLNVHEPGGKLGDSASRALQFLEGPTAGLAVVTFATKKASG